MANENGTTSRLLNRLSYDFDNKASDVGTATTSDKLLGYDDSTGIMKRFEGDDVLAVSGVTATATEINRAADASGFSQELTATGTVTSGVQSLELNHATVIAAATIADAENHAGFFYVVNTSASGTAAHTLTLTAGTFDGTNNVATLDAPAESLLVFFDGSGDGRIILNTGSVGLA